MNSGKRWYLLKLHICLSSKWLFYIITVFENRFMAALIVHCLRHSDSCIRASDWSFFFPEYVPEVYPLRGEGQKKGVEVIFNIGQSCPMWRKQNQEKYKAW